MSNSTLSGNSASSNSPSGGGGIYNGGGVTITNSTLTDNSALVGGSIRNINGARHGDSVSTILAGGSGGDCSGAVTDDGYNIDDDGSCGVTLPSISDYATLSRTLGPLANNGGPTQTIALLPANPAIEYVPAADCPPTDQRGYTRTPPCDIGAWDNGALNAQTIAFTSTAPSNATVGGPAYLVQATGGASGNAVTLAIDASSTSVCSLSGSTVSFLGAGTCAVDANQAGNADYTAAPEVQQSFTVYQDTPSTPTITNIPGTGVAVFGGSFIPAVSTNGDGAKSVTSSTSTICTVSSGMVSFVGVGNCTLTAHVADGTNYSAANGTPQSFLVGQAAQSVTFTSTRPTNAIVDGPSYLASATGGASGNPVVLTVDSSASSVCSISGSLVNFTGPGTCAIDANQTGDADYGPALQAQQSFSVGPAPPAITSPDAASATVGTAFSFSVTTTGAPAPSIVEKGKLPVGLAFTDHGNGTATFTGTPKKRSLKHLTIVATFGTGTDEYVVTQAFTLTVNPK